MKRQHRIQYKNHLKQAYAYSPGFPNIKKTDMINKNTIINVFTKAGFIT